MIYTHTIGRIGKDCRVITGTHGTFMAVDIAVDDYSKGRNITTWVRVKSSKENHIRLAEYLTKGRMVLVEGTLTSSIWTDRNEENHIQHSIIADSIAFVNTGKKETADNTATQVRKAVKAEGNTPEPPADAPQDKDEDLPF
ncbi:MAG: single-stranded DNA-binding protein [Prevotellaceae bacterium]|nr:single-stranded DNA-binding protein [Prevotellaceae bacterium]